MQVLAESGRLPNMKSPSHTYTVEGTSLPDQADEDELDKLAEYMVRYGVESPAVLLLDEGRLGCTAQVQSTSGALALSEFTAATPWIRWWQLNVYEGVPE